MKSTSVAPSLREQCNKCRHFTGIGNNPDGSRRKSGEGRGACRAEVKYDDVQKQGRRMIALPCFPVEPDNMPADGVWPTCEKLSFKTTAELDAEAAEIERTTSAVIQKMMVVRPAILRHAGVVQRPQSDDERDGGREQKEPDKNGSFACPACKTGTLHYRISGYNGHVWARCETEGCCSWME